MGQFQIDEIQLKLIEKAKQGDEESFETLILSCKGKAYGIAFRYLKNEDDAMDALQDSFIKIYRGLEKFNCEAKFETWVYRIVVNTCNDLLRRRKSRPQTEDLMREFEDNDVRELQIADTGATPEESFIQKESGAYILECLEKLKPEQKEVIILRDINGFSYDEIAKILECSEGTVKSRISRARLHLREIYIEGQKD